MRSPTLSDSNIFVKMQSQSLIFDIKMGRIRDMLAGLGFIITAALVTTNVMPDQLIGIRTQST